MRVRPVPFRHAVLGGKGAAALLLALCSAPALASTGVDDAAIDVVDPATASSVTVVEISPRVASILREIFDENATHASLPSAAPLAKLIAPDLREKSHSDNETDIRNSESDLTRVNSNLSGVSEDELSRFRRQMFRTDI